MGSRKDIPDLRDVLIDAHAHFFFIKGEEAQRLRLWQILPDCVVIDRPIGAPMRRTVLGYVPTLDGGGVYEVQGVLNTEPLPDQMSGTVRVEVDTSSVRKINRRAFPRVSFTPPIAAIAIAGDKKQEIAVKVINLSAGGLRIESGSSLHPTESYTFRFKIETDDEIHELNLLGTIVYELPSQTGHVYGIRFGGPKPSKEGAKQEAPLDELDQTASLLMLVNKLMVREG